MNWTLRLNARALMLATVIALATGCVSQRQYDDLQTLYRRSQEQIVDLQAQLEEKQAEIEVLKAHAQDPAVLSKLEAAVAERDRLAKALATAEEQLRALGASPALEPELNTALMDLVRSDPALMSYDPAMGMVKFRSDLTFALGSTDVSAEATASLNKLAGILRSPVASKYEARIVGHTDNVRISRPATKAQHPTNWHLSVHRAIAVKDVLVKAGVPETQVGVGGYGEFRPVTSNTRGGNAANRRVEIYLVRNPHKREFDQAVGEPVEVAPPPGTPTSPAPVSGGQEEPPEMFK